MARKRDKRALKHRTKTPRLTEAPPIPDFCPGCSRSKHVAEYDTPSGKFTYLKLFCRRCQATLTPQQITSRGRSYMTKYRGSERYTQIKRARKYLPQTLQ